MTTTWSFGFANLIPVAKAKALPCVVWTVLKSKYPVALEEQPIPDTTQTSF